MSYIYEIHRIAELLETVEIVISHLEDKKLANELLELTLQIYNKLELTETQTQQ